MKSTRIPVLLAIPIALMLLGAGTTSLAQEESRFQGSVGLHFPVDVDDSVDAHIGFTGSVRYTVADNSLGRWSAQLQYTVFTARGNRFVHLVLPQIELTPSALRGMQWEVGAGIGPLFAFNNAGKDATDLGLTLSVRYKVPQGQTIELRGLYGPKEGESGVQLGIVFPLRR